MYIKTAVLSSHFTLAAVAIAGALFAGNASAEGHKVTVVIRVQGGSSARPRHVRCAPDPRVTACRNIGCAWAAAAGAFAGFAGANLSRCSRPQAATSSVATRCTCFSVRGRWSVRFLAPRHVHRDFHAKPKVNRLRNLPPHRVSSARRASLTFSQGRHDARHNYAKILTHHFVSVKNEGHHARRTVLRRITRSSSSCLLTPEGCAYRLPQEAGVVGAAATFGIPLSSTRALQRVRSARKKAVKSSDVVLPASPPSSAISFLISGVLNMPRIA
jgi:hypothetical protein